MVIPEKVYTEKNLHIFRRPKGWWARLKQWVWLMWYGERFVVGYDFGSSHETKMVCGYVDRKGIFHIERIIKLNVPATAKAIQAMGISFKEVASAFGGLGKAWKKYEEREKDDNRK